ncbi:MAG: tRNA (N(6)-L-threonylcarbamoyladenosine(37)-C(2))-methylthiotransferase MtaB [Desulfobacterales bacterium]|nr:tRNA (N(6)-L-threonylcarbamoyladenosine(37)-C(2))-methylthiotransferase MtaB [Desulfobacterales bacterium]
MTKKFTIKTLGCKVNQFESELLARSLAAGEDRESRWAPSKKGEASDLCIINTCTVTHKASMQSRQAVRQAIRSNPGARIIVTGCYAQTEPDAIRKITGVHDIVGHADKLHIPGMIPRRDESASPPDAEADHPGEPADPIIDTVRPGGRTRPFLKIQDGCNAFCSYCIVPHARGRSRSTPPDAALAQVVQLARAGSREVVLTGIHLGCYGRDLTPQTSLMELLTRVHGADAIQRVRLSSIEPRELTDEIIALAAETTAPARGEKARPRTRLCPHFHIPLQSGDNNILKRMRRPYTREVFRERVLEIRRRAPDAAIGADVLIGFPGETDAAFENTLSLIRELPLTYLHVFPFSSRKGTPAHDFPDKVPDPVIKERCRRARALGRMKKKEFCRGFIGRTLEVLVEGRRDRTSGLLKGVTPNYLTVLLPGEDSLKNTLVNVPIDSAEEDRLIAGPLCV